MNNSFRIIFIKINVIKADIIKIYTKNIHLITKESNNIRVYKIEVCIIIREYNFNYTNQSGTDFNAKRQVSTAISHIFGVLRLSGQYFSVKGCLETTLSHIS